jgi:hypothetical protein
VLTMPQIYYNQKNYSNQNVLLIVLYVMKKKNVMHFLMDAIINVVLIACFKWIKRNAIIIVIHVKFVYLVYLFTINIFENIFFLTINIFIMFCIKLKFTSDVKDIFTMWEETSDNEFYFHLKIDRMINHWLRILKDQQVVDRTDIESENVIYSDDKLCMMKMKYLMIQRQIDLLNNDGVYGKNREFTIKVFRGDNYHQLKEFTLF